MPFVWALSLPQPCRCPPFALASPRRKVTLLSMNRTLPHAWTSVAWSATILAAFAFTAPLHAAGTEAPVVGPQQAVAGNSQQILDDAAGALQANKWIRAVELYTKAVNLDNAEQRGQARYGLAIALAQLGQEDKALTALDGTLVDDTPLGKAIGTLRGQILLQLADKALAEQGPGAANLWLGQYDRLTIKPDQPRYDRIKAAGDVVTGSTPGEPTRVLRVGVLLPMNGPLAPVGEDVLRGLQLGLKEFDGRRGTRVELIPMDSSDAATSQDSAQKLLAQQVDIVAGPLLGNVVEKVGDVFRPAKIPVLTFSSDRAVMGDGVYALSYLPAEQGRAMARFAVADGHTKLAGLIPSTPYGYEVYEAFQDEARKLGAAITGSAFYNPQNSDIGANIRTLVGKETAKDSKSFVPPFDALFLPAPAAALPLVAAQLSYYDVDKAGVQLLGTALWQDNGLLLPSASAVRGGTFAVPPKVDAFEGSFKATYGAAPHPLAVIGYDAARILADLAAEKQRLDTPLDTLLERPEGFYGSGGYLRFASNGVTQRGLNIVKVGEQFEVIQPALNLAPLAIPANLIPRGQGRWGW